MWVGNWESGCDRLVVERAEEGDIPFIERLGVFAQHDIAIVRGGGSSYSRAITPDEFLFLDAWFRQAVACWYCV